MLGVTGYWNGDHSEAVATLESALSVAESEGNELGQSYATGYLALARTALGDLEDASALSTAAITLSEAGGFSEHFVAMIGHLAAGRLEERRGELESAEDTLSRALALARRGAGALELAAALISSRAGAPVARRSRGGRGRCSWTLAKSSIPAPTPAIWTGALSPRSTPCAPGRAVPAAQPPSGTNSPTAK